jgi:hypothetical protein
MTGNISFNPVLTTNGVGGFNVSADGLIQGQVMDDPSARFRLSGGVLASDETLPMWGGVGIYELTGGLATAAARNYAAGNVVGRATSVTAQAAKQLVGFSVFDQAYNAINTPQSPVPLAAPGMSVNWYRLGSNARIAVAMDPSLVDLEGNIITQLVSWDFINQRLTQYTASDATEAITSQTWSATNGGQVAVVMTAPAVEGLGDTINISGAVGNGTNTDFYNGTFVINTWTDTTHFTYLKAGPTAVAGACTTPGDINVGVGALPCKILRVKTENCMIVAYDSATGFATWDRNGAAALIQI